MAAGGEQFDSSRAELFEALGHPTRVRILRVLEKNPVGFAELKREVGIESSGHLQFHLGKLDGLVGTTPEGNYFLTDEGKEAIRILGVSSSGTGSAAARTRNSLLGRLGLTRLVIAFLLIILVVMAGITFYQQQQITELNQNLSTGTVVIGHTTYYYEELPLFFNAGTSVMFHGVTFAFGGPMSGVKYANLPNYTAEGSLRLSNGTTLNLNGKTVREEFQGYIVSQCWTNQLGANDTDAGAGIVMSSFLEPPTVTITFADKSQETYNAPVVTARAIPSLPPYILLNYSLLSVPPNPWFGQHMGPQAGVFFDCSSPQGDLTIYVSQ